MLLIYSPPLPGGIKKDREKLGDLLLGNRIENSPYVANMATSVVSIMALYFDGMRLYNIMCQVVFGPSLYYH